MGKNRTVSQSIKRLVLTFVISTVAILTKLFYLFNDPRVNPLEWADYMMFIIWISQILLFGIIIFYFFKGTKAEVQKVPVRVTQKWQDYIVLLVGAIYTVWAFVEFGFEGIFLTSIWAIIVFYIILAILILGTLRNREK